MHFPRVAFVLLLLCALGFSQSSTSAKPAPGFSIDTIDKSVDPCVDFYEYACGNWIKKAEIPPDQSQWVSFVELHERNMDIMRGILEKASKAGASRNAIDQKIGDMYGS
ncbi:MAG TPA: M13 family metallopeptidase N-terminal domain-containing protein, partial [Candidatus Eisenbacteria bacterium]|nr:M13 family metallopeptidase N-terminal domain-containing protein [Candidatus Eisenbacteria bacterium]